MHNPPFLNIDGLKMAFSCPKRSRGFRKTGPRKIKGNIGKLTSVESTDLHDVSRVKS